MARVAFEAGVKISGTSTPLTADLLEWADHVLVMEIRHAEAVRRVAAEASISDPSVALLGPFAGVQEISDPHGSWTYGPYRRARLLLQRAVVAHLEHLAATLEL
jgi:protein-tyrosine-phosphatase